VIMGDFTVHIGFISEWIVDGNIFEIEGVVVDGDIIRQRIPYIQVIDFELYWKVEVFLFILVLELFCSAKGEYLYECLELPKTATQDEIKKAYRKVTWIQFPNFYFLILKYILFSLACFKISSR
jgi:hypothetical protein